MCIRDRIGTDSRTRQHNRRLCPDRTTETDGNGTGYDGRPSVMPVSYTHLERGLTLSEEKTVITNIRDGFDFLGFNIRKFGNEILTKPCLLYTSGHFKGRG